MFRTNTCGELRLADAGKNVTLAGWVQRTRKMGGMTFVDLRDRYGITQLVFNTDVNAELCDRANHLGREFVIQVKGVVSERSSKNSNLPTGDIEIIVSELNILNTALTPPFTIEDNTDGGDDLRMKYRYLDLRRTAVRKNLELRHRMTMEVRRYLDSKGFLEVETPMLIGSTPEGARDFVVPSRMNPGQFYAASVTSDLEAVADGFWFRPLLPDCKMFPRRRPACRPSAGIYPDRLRNEFRRTGRHHSDVRGYGKAFVQGTARCGTDRTVYPYAVGRCHEVLW